MNMFSNFMNDAAHVHVSLTWPPYLKLMLGFSLLAPCKLTGNGTVIHRFLAALAICSLFANYADDSHPEDCESRKDQRSVGKPCHIDGTAVVDPILHRGEDAPGDRLCCTHPGLHLVCAW